MATLPDLAMQNSATAVIELLGDDTAFVRKSGDTWVSSETATVHKQTALSEYTRAKMGIESNTDYSCWAPVDSDIQTGDRTVIGGVYWEVYSLNDWGTHLEFGLKNTKVGP